MITQLDKTNLDAKSKNLPFRGDLAQFIDDVALLKPKANFVIDNDCVSTDYVINETTNQYDRLACIYRAKIFEGGEELGSISVYEEYRKGKKTPTYAVESFRITKHRGRGNTTSSMHKKVALANAKKSLVARVKDELAEQIGNNVMQRIESLANSVENQVIWSHNQTHIARDYALAAYQARLSGSGVVTLDVSVSRYCSNIQNADRMVATYLQYKELQDMVKAKRGYGIQGYLDGSFVAFSFATGEVTKYPSIDDMPQNISEKLSMFKLIEQNEAYSHLGVKLLDHLYFIVDGKTIADA